MLPKIKGFILYFFGVLAWLFFIAMLVGGAYQESKQRPQQSIEIQRSK